MAEAPTASLLPGTFNARDLGGLAAGERRVRAGALIRSDAPVALGEPGREALAALGVATAVDLREAVERDAAPPDFGALDIITLPRPLLQNLAVDPEAGLNQLYTSLLDGRGPAFAEAVAAVADAASKPVLLFCSAGKDRTGLLTALLLALLGVEDDDIVADYHRTETNLQGAFRERIQATALASGLSEQQVAVNLGAPAELMAEVLVRLREQGGAEAYLRRHGLPAEAIEQLRAQLLEP
jgi:protein-tyrosine phosphatase